MNVENEMKRLGFSRWYTGGNCTAWGDIDGDVEVIITDDEGYSAAPTELDESAMIGLYRGGDVVEDFTTTLRTIVAGLRRMRKDGAFIDRAVEYVATADRLGE